MATTNTISGQLNRISTSANTIWKKAADMALSLPAGSYWNYDLTNLGDKSIYGTSNKITGDDSNAVNYVISATGTEAAYNFGIDAVAAAINAINVKNYLETDSNNNYLTKNQSINAGVVIKIPVGYNKTAFTITAKSIGSQLQDTSAAAKYIYTGKTAYIKNAAGNHEKITGTLSNVYLYAPSGAYNAAKVNGNNLKVSINSAWASDNTLNPAELLETNIPYRNTQTTAPIIGSTTVEGTIGVQTNVSIGSYEIYSGPNSTGKTAKKYLKITPTAGYYDSAWSTNIPYNPTISQNIEISRYANDDGTTTNTVNSLTIKKGYYSDDIIITPVVKDRGENTENILNYTDITLSENENGNYTFTGGTRSDKFDYSGGSIVFNPNSYGGKSYDYFGTVTLNAATVSTNTNGTFEVSKGGWINQGTYGAAYGGLSTLVKADITNASSSDTEDVTISTQKFSITVPKGKMTSSAAVSKVYLIRNASHSLAKQNPDTYSNTKTYAKNDVVKYNGKLYICKNAITTAQAWNATNWTLGTTIDSQYFIDQNTVSGWLNAFKTGYNIQDFAYNTAASTSSLKRGEVTAAGWINKTNSAGTKYYISTSLYNGGSATTITPGASATEIAAGTYIAEKLTISAVNAGTAKYKITTTDMSDSDSKINIAASADIDESINTYMTSIEVDLTNILLELQKI